MPPDWAAHTRCWMAWPCREAPWGGELEEARRAYAEVAQLIARFEPVTMIVRPELVAMASLYCGPGITVLPMPHDDSWVRDTGPEQPTACRALTICFWHTTDRVPGRNTRTAQFR